MDKDCVQTLIHQSLILDEALERFWELKMQCIYEDVTCIVWCLIIIYNRQYHILKVALSHHLSCPEEADLSPLLEPVDFPLEQSCNDVLKQVAMMYGGGVHLAMNISW